jgi:hypothetical protein
MVALTTIPILKGKYLLRLELEAEDLTRGSYYFLAKEPYTVRQYTGYGFLNIDVIDNGQTFNATFYSNFEGIKDQFSITKNVSTTDYIE